MRILSDLRARWALECSLQFDPSKHTTPCACVRRVRSRRVLEGVPCSRSFSSSSASPSARPSPSLVRPPPMPSAWPAAPVRVQTATRPAAATGKNARSLVPAARATSRAREVAAKPNRRTPRQSRSTVREVVALSPRQVRRPARSRARVTAASTPAPAHNRARPHNAKAAVKRAAMARRPASRAARRPREGVRSTAKARPEPYLPRRVARRRPPCRRSPAQETEPRGGRARRTRRVHEPD